MAEAEDKKKPLSFSEKFRNICLGIAAMSALILGLVNAFKGEPTAEKAWETSQEAINKNRTAINKLGDGLRKLHLMFVHMQGQQEGYNNAKLLRKIEELELKTIPEITNAIKAGGACMSCHHTPGGLQDILNKVWGERPTAFKELPVLPMARAPKAQPPTEIIPFKFAKKVEEVLDSYVRPQLAKDAGDIEIIDIKDTKVYCSMKGACANCMGSQNTIKMLVEQALKDQVDQRIQVIEV